jgi:hypothetical protein
MNQVLVQNTVQSIKKSRGELSDLLNQCEACFPDLYRAGEDTLDSLEASISILQDASDRGRSISPNHLLNAARVLDTLAAFSLNFAESRFLEVSPDNSFEGFCTLANNLRALAGSS